MGKRSKREEEYLEALYILAKEKEVIRIKDVARMLRVKPSSVVEYLGKLSQKGLVRYEKREFVTLTDEGRRIAEEIYRRHVALKKFLMLLLRVPEDIAERDACYIEHGIHEVTLTRILRFIEFVENCPVGVPEFLKHLEYYYAHNEYPPECYHKKEEYCRGEDSR
ncbi:MAG: metal-dependent transcriptional regulator [Candidatus Baldrarchaeia archaeon]